MLINHCAAIVDIVWSLLKNYWNTTITTNICLTKIVRIRGDLSNFSSVPILRQWMQMNYYQMNCLLLHFTLQGSRGHLLGSPRTPICKLRFLFSLKLYKITTWFGTAMFLNINWTRKLKNHHSNQDLLRYRFKQIHKDTCKQSYALNMCCLRVVHDV